MKKLIGLLFGLLTLVVGSFAISFPIADALEISNGAAFVGAASVGVLTSFIMPQGVLGMAIAYADLNGRDGTFENPGGTEQIIYFAPISDFETIQAPPAFSAVTGPDDAVEISADHTFITGKKFNKMKIIMNTGKVTGEQVGDKGGRSIATKFEGFYVGDVKEVLGLQRLMKEDEYIILAPLADGSVVQIGTEKKPADMSVGFDSGTQNEGVRGAPITVEANDVAAWIYSGAISLTPAV